MAGWFSNAMSWLGLVDDLQDDRGHYGGGAVTAVDETTDSFETVSTIAAVELPANITKITDISARRATESHAATQVEPQPAAPEAPVVLHAFSYSDMELIGKQFRSGRAVLMNLAGMIDRKEMRRLIDFSSGMVYALNGKAEKIAEGVFLLQPNGVRVDEGFLGRLGLEVARSA